MVVADARLVACGAAGGIEPPGETRTVQRLAHVVSGLGRDAHPSPAYPVDHLINAGMIGGRLEYREDTGPGGGDPQPGIAQPCG